MAVQSQPENLTLVIGCWKPGTENQRTLSLGHSSIASAMANRRDSNFRPDFVGDFMKIPEIDLGEKIYSRVIFQGVCPIAEAMGAQPCGGKYEAIKPQELARKIKNLMSQRGGLVFFRHCIEAAHPEGVINPAKRKEFIQAFIEIGMDLVPEKPGPQHNILEHCPGPEVLDEGENRFCHSKWDVINGGMIFFYPGEAAPLDSASAAQP